jgi:N-acetylglucosamine kinase-like BadF-type ATPase
MSLYLAIDAGGTKTDYLLADDARELARVRSGTIKRMRADSSTVADNLADGLAKLEQLSGLPLPSITRTCIGISGASVPLVTDWLREALAARVSPHVILLGDIEIALDAAFPGRPGVLVLAGTGSNVAGRNHAGVITTAGGWGPVLGDQGSGYGIGMSAIRALCMAIDEQKPTPLLPAVLKLWNLNSVDEMVSLANSLPAPDFPALTQVVLQCAQQGDPVAAGVLQRQGEHLARIVRIVIDRLRTTSPNAAWLPSIAFAGSIMESVTPVRDALIAALHRDYPTLTTVPGVVDPIAGALWRARHTHSLQNIQP